MFNARAATSAIGRMAASSFRASTVVARWSRSSPFHASATARDDLPEWSHLRMPALSPTMEIGNLGEWKVEEGEVSSRRNQTRV